MTTAARAEHLEHLSSSEYLQASAEKEEYIHPHSNTPSVLDNHQSSSSAPPHRNTPATTGPHPDSSSSVKATKRGLLDRFFNSELGRFVCALVYFAVVCIAMAFCNQFSDQRWVQTNYRNILLQDRGFDIFPAMKDITPANIFVMTSIVFTLIGMALICPTWTARGIVLRRVLWVVGTLSVYRALTLSVTTLPTPKEGCKPATETSFGAMFWVALQMIPGTVQACTDDIFSGHTMFMVTCAIQWRLYCRNKWVTYFTYIYITVGLYFVVATRLHYTVDVVLAIFITYSVWSLYMAMIDVVMEKEYFGLRRHSEKYKIFDSRWAEEQDVHAASTTSDDPEKERIGNVTPETTTSSAFATKKAKLQHKINRMRGSGIGYDQGEHDRVAFVPMQYNTWLTGAVRWCDGLDLRMHQSATGPGECHWDEWVHEQQSRHSVEPSRPVQSSSPKRQGVESNLEAGLGSHDEIETSHVRDTTVEPTMLESIHVVRNP
ncbi:hypothetical protein BGZ51_002328 [Haplosporangium sp. Z 767]|nr:hypothetical protein BGZ51_002328 [Haplosporangium sp. Z 767]